MFVYYFVNIDAPFETAERGILERLSGLAAIADESYRAGEAIPVDSGALGGLARSVGIESGPPVRSPTETTVPLMWEATGPRVLFPKMDADLVVARVGPTMTQVSFRGSYTPPLGKLGQTLDRAVMHRVAEAVVKRFIDRIADSIISETGPSHATSQ